jgi:3-isopropylmalate/(R)-2-methylmalate dehydratase large subunit
MPAPMSLHRPAVLVSGDRAGIPADGYNVISTANRNFKGRMGNKESNIYLVSCRCGHGSPAGMIVDPRNKIE